MNYLVYDLEMVNCIPSRNEPYVEGLVYCGGWDDHQGMGISCICAYDYQEQQYRVFLGDSFLEFLELLSNRVAVTFNGKGFDEKVLEAVLGKCPSLGHYDICAEMRIASGCHPATPVRGISLDKTAKANLTISKTGKGGLAPVMWQQGKKGAVIDYCLQDVNITKLLFDKVLAEGCLVDPRNQTEYLQLANPEKPLMDKAFGAA